MPFATWLRRTWLRRTWLRADMSRSGSDLGRPLTTRRFRSYSGNARVSVTEPGRNRDDSPTGSAAAGERELGEPRPVVRVLRRDHDPLLERAAVATRVEQVRAGQLQRLAVRDRVGQLEGGAVLGEAEHELAV